MKYLKFQFLFLAAFMILATSCEEENLPEESVITYLPKLVVNGSSNMILDCDAASYADAGVDASEGGQPVTATVGITAKYFGSAAVDGSDDYIISYSAVNKDGIPGAVMRNVLWPECNGDLVSSIAGMYRANVVRNDVVDPTYQGLDYIFIKDLGNNVYQLSDAIGAYYDKGRGYGYHYAGTGMTVTANDIPGNDFTYGANIGVGLFGGDLAMKAFSVDAANRKITFTTDWSFGLTFVVELTQIDL